MTLEEAQIIANNPSSHPRSLLEDALEILVKDRLLKKQRLAKLKRFQNQK